MRKIKVFVGGSHFELEAMINKWLAENASVDILHMSQSEDESRVLVTLLYRE